MLLAIRLALCLAFPCPLLLSTSAHWPRWAYMWLLAAAIYFACKMLTWRTAIIDGVPFRRQWAYLLAWPGMNAARFFDVSRRPQVPRLSEWGMAALNLIAGIAIFWNAQQLMAPSSAILLGWAGMVGTILMLHFGSFYLVSCFWRQLGIDASPLMNQPIRSTSVAEFWGRRWNSAFRDLTHQFLFRPLTHRWGPMTALVVAFFVSGLVHEVVISLPAGGGYGGPTLFFAIQAVAILFERSSIGKSLGLGRSWQGWLITGLVLLMPIRLLFHDPFVTRIAVPFMKALGAA
jgi:hypothetical protein